MSKLYTVLFIVLFLVSAAPADSFVDLGIADDETYKRPNAWSKLNQQLSPAEKLLVGDSTGPASRPGVSIAWRNANQVEEVEVRVRNLGDEPGFGKVSVEILDETGKVLLHLDPPDDQKQIRVPAKDRGGLDGKVLRMKASWELNTLIDRFDITRTRYHVMATVVTEGKDFNLLDNRKVKSWNAPTRVKPNHVNVYNYVFKNYQAHSLKYKWLFEHTPYPEGWKIEGVPTDTNEIVWKPGEEIRGTLLMKAPEKPNEGEFLEGRLSLVNAENNEIILQNEWFQIYDTQPPDISNYRAVLMDDGQIAIQALVADKGSGILEATGVSTEFSVDGGRTWARKPHNYKVGNFIRPTLFETVIGPFKQNTKVQLRFTALDTAGNAATVIPVDATAFRAPPNANVLLQSAYLFPRTQANPLFEIDKLRELKVTMEKLRSLDVDVESLDFTKPNPLNVDPQRLKELGLESSRLQDLMQDLKKVEKSDIDFNKISHFTLKRLGGPIDEFLGLTTIEIETN